MRRLQEPITMSVKIMEYKGTRNQRYNYRRSYKLRAEAAGTVPPQDLSEYCTQSVLLTNYPVLSGMNIPDHISESLETISWVKNT
jgi:hypothetical protein